MKKLQRLASGMGLLVATTMTTSVAAQQFKTLNNTPAAQLQATEMAEVRGKGDPASFYAYWYLTANGPTRDSLARASQGINASTQMLCQAFGICQSSTPAKVIPAKTPKPPSSLDIPNGVLPKGVLNGQGVNSPNLDILNTPSG